MSRINTNVSAIQAMTSLNKNNNDLSVRLNRLSTGLRINAGKDDPAGLVASENLRGEMAGIGQAIDNSVRAGSVIATAEGALNEVSALLIDLKGLINNSANEGAMSNEEIKANQLQINSAVASINRIANSTVFQGKKLLNGSMDFNVAGVDTSEIKDLRLNQVRFGTADSVDVNVTVDTAATKGALYFDGSALGGDVTIEIRGDDGNEFFSLGSGLDRSGIALAINEAMAVTGVSAISSADIDGAGTSGVLLQSTGYGSKKYVSVDVVSGTFATTDAAAAASNRETGTDAMVSINGVSAVCDGLDVQINGPTVSFTAKLDASINIDATTSTFTVTGGGAQFQLGPTVNAQQTAIIGIESVAAHMLGSAEHGYLTDIRTGGSKSVLAGESADADAIVSDAISQVANLRGRLGAFQKNVLTTNINSLNVALENVTASESAIRDADFARETSALTRAQILVQAGTSVLAVANSAPQNVLALLG